ERFSSFCALPECDFPFYFWQVGAASADVSVRRVSPAIVSGSPCRTSYRNPMLEFRSSPFDFRVERAFQSMVMDSIVTWFCRTLRTAYSEREGWQSGRCALRRAGTSLLTFR